MEARFSFGMSAGRLVAAAAVVAVHSRPLGVASAAGASPAPDNGSLFCGGVSCASGHDYHMDSISLLSLSTVVEQQSLGTAMLPARATAGAPPRAVGAPDADRLMPFSMHPSGHLRSHSPTTLLQLGEEQKFTSGGAVFALTAIIVSLAVAASCCWIWPATTLRQTAVLLKQQISSLSWKNYLINTRTTLPGCSSCNTCTIQVACPAIYVFMMIVVPYLSLKATNEEFIFDYDVEYGRDYEVNKTYTGFDRRNLDYLYQPPRYTENELEFEDMSIVPLWRPSFFGQQDDFNAGACSCRTMGFVGPNAEMVKDYFNATYQRWIGDAMARYGAFTEDDLGMQQKQCPAEYKGPMFRVYRSRKAVDDIIADADYAKQLDLDRDPSQPERANLDRLCAVIVLNNDVLTEPVPKLTIGTNVTGYDYFGDVAGKYSSEKRMGREDNQFAFFWYLQSGYLTIQDQMQRFIAEQRYGRTDLPEPDFVAVPSDAYTQNEFSEELLTKVAGNSFTTIVFASNVVTVAYFMIRERQSKQKELMRLMGLFDSSLFLSWVMLFALINFFVTLIVAVMIYGIMIERSDFTLLFAILYLAGMGVTAMGMALSTMFSSERLGSLCAFGVLQITGIVFVSLKLDNPDADKDENAVSEDVSMELLYALSLLPAVGFILTVNTYLKMDLYQDGCTWGRIYQQYDRYKVGYGLNMLIMSFFSFIMLYVYLEQIMQHDVGIARPWYFPLTPSFWQEVFGHGTLSFDDAGTRAIDDDRPEKGDYYEAEDSEMQRDLRNQKEVIKVRNLTKVFTDASGQVIPAIDGLNLTMYKNECFCLLGHNGAGKTTTMSVMTGMIEQTSGTVEVFGQPMPQEKLTVRKSMGFCMQHNVLWDVLTVSEHMVLFGSLVGLTKEETEERSADLLEKVELSYKKDAKANALSGGMKRKLNVGMALLGGSAAKDAVGQVLILDEPTAGMDPHTRRQLWGVLKALRADRILCLTTHYMDEADELGDRICIMVRGKSSCSGSNKFLKNALGVGYMLNFVKKAEQTPNEPIENVVKKYCGNDVVRATANGRELRLRVPFAGASSFPRLMKDLDRNSKTYGLETYGVGVSDLEDVFLKIACEEHNAPTPIATTTASSRAASIEDRAERKAVPFGVQFKALLQRRVRYGYRDSRMFTCQVMMPFLCIFIFLSLQHQIFDKMNLDYDPIEATTAGWNADDDVTYAPTLATSAGGLGTADLDAEYFATGWYETLPEGVTEVFLNTSLDIKESLIPTDENLTEAQQVRAVSYTYEEAYSRWCRPLQDQGRGPHFGGVLYTNGKVVFFPNGSAYWAAPTLFNLHFAEWLANATAEAEENATAEAEENNSALLQKDFNPVEKINLINEPLHATTREEAKLGGASAIILGMIVILAFSFIPAGVAAFVATEKETDVKHQLLISGTGKFAYWSSNFMFDLIFGVFSVIGLLFALWFFGEEAWLEWPRWPATVSLLVAYVPASILFAYTLAHFSTTGGGALIGVLLVGLVVGILGYDMSTMLTYFNNLQFAGDLLLWTCRILVPTTCVGKGLCQLSMWKTYSDNEDMSPFSGQFVGGGARVEDISIYNAGDDIFALLLDSVLYALALYLLETGRAYPMMRRLLCMAPEETDFECPTDMRLTDDDHVAAEKQRVAGLDRKTQVVLCDDVYKSYSEEVHAVRGITYAIEGGQCFGLLGVNGAGKTTTFKMMCGQISPSKGEVYVKGHRVKTELDEVRKLIGYCPQFNALLDLLTVREHIELFSQVKGITGDALEAEVRSKIALFDLTAFENSRSCQLSGGNARKLQTAIAMIGEPPIIFLDEPSAGMDPVARRYMWNVIEGVSKSRPDSAVILTTHSMEEADALCSRIVLQASGQVRCIGTPQQLKEWYGTGLELGIRLESPSARELDALAAAWKLPLDEKISDVEMKQRLVEKYAVSSKSIREAIVKIERVQALAAWCITQERITAVTAFLKTKCGKGKFDEKSDIVSILEQHAGAVHYRLVGDKPGGGPKSYGEMFSLVQANVADLKLADFQLSQGTLERTFNRIAAEDMERVVKEGRKLEEG